MCNKQTYHSKRKAKQAAYAIKAKGRINPRQWLNSYWCKSCQGWHLSKMNGEEWFHSLK